MRLMGLDVGTKTIGVAVSDESCLIAQPLCVIRRSSFSKDLEEISRLVREHSVETIVVGMPINMNGTPGPRYEQTQRFIDRIKDKIPARIETWDERLSTKAGTRVLIEGNESRARRKEVVDKLAASYILQGYLDSLRPGGV